MKAAAIIVAGGSSARIGGKTAKQFTLLHGRPLYVWSVDAFARHDGIDEIIVVLPDGSNLPAPADNVRYVTGGVTRAASVIAGLAVLDCPDDTPVLIHDAARPGLTRQLISALLAALDNAEAAAPALPVVDALKRRAETLETVPREDLFRVQTPQAFSIGLIRKALREASTEIRDDLEAVESLGVRVDLVPGDIRLRKITYAEDFEIMTQMLAPSSTPPRIGTGFDVHAFGTGNHVTLCGVRIPHDKGLDGHSDADVGWHALTDAILGAVAMGDIGDHFPPSDDQWKDADSALFLQHAQKLAREIGYEIANVDMTLICEAPKVKPHREAMRASTAELLGLPIEAISIKATTTEGLGFTGRREGMAAQASVVLSKRVDQV